MKKGRLCLISLMALLFGLFIVSNNTTSVKANSDLNDYILQNKFQPASIDYEEGTFDQWFGYENGVGKPEGVVVHETATPGVGARAYAQSFNNNWRRNQSYVHAFVDDTAIVNIHNTNYGVWGAGPSANYRYVQIELCEVDNWDKLARSVVNDAYYVVGILNQYHLPDVPGQTVLSHHQISNIYGETHHTDPDGYFARWGYSMDQFNDLVSYFYNNEKATGNMYDDGSQAQNNANVIGVKNSDKAYVPMVQFEEDGRTSDITNRALANDSYWVTDQTKTFNGHNYYRVSTNEWVQDTYVTNR